MSTYLVTGGNRGIGLELVKQLGARPNSTVIVTVRKNCNISKLDALGYKNLHIIELDMTDDLTAFKEAFKDLEALTPNGLDVVVHNVGVASNQHFSKAEEQDLDQYENTFAVNGLGSVKLYKALAPRLDTNGKPFKLIFISSTVATMGAMGVYKSAAYGMSKAALNYLAKCIALERKDKGDIVVPVCPGLVDTDMASAAKGNPAMIQPEESVSDILKLADSLTIDQTGTFFSHDGSVIPY